MVPAMRSRSSFEEPAFPVGARRVVPGETDRIEACLRQLVQEDAALVCTTGGTGLAPRDMTPEATKRVIEREAPGLAEIARQVGLSETKHAALSRGVAGVAGGRSSSTCPEAPVERPRL